MIYYLILRHNNQPDLQSTSLRNNQQVHNKSPSPKANEPAIPDLREKLNRKLSYQSPPQSPTPSQLSTASNELPVKDLRQVINRKALPLTAPSSMPKTTTASPPSPQTTSKPAFVLSTAAPPFRPLNQSTVLPQQQFQQQPPPVREPIPIVEPPISRLQQRLRITAPPEANRSAGPQSTPPVPVIPESAPNAAPIPTVKPIVRSKLSDRLIQRPAAVPITAPPAARKLTPPAAPVIVQPAGYPYTQPPPTNGHMPQKDPITALATYSKSLGHGIPEYKILRVPKTNRIQCRVMVRIKDFFLFRMI